MRYLAAMRLFAPCAFLVGLVALGCGVDASNPSSSEGTGGVSPDAGPAGSGGASGASGGAGSADAGTPARSGFIGVTSQKTAVAGVFLNSVFVGFADGPGSSFTTGCERQVVGACQILLCDYSDGGGTTPPPGAPESAGTVTIGGTTPAFSLDYDAGTKKYVAAPAVPTDQLLFAGGETITFTGAGRDVPAFASTLVAPAPIGVTAPSLASGLSIDTGKDLTFSWTGSSAGKIAFNIRTTTSSAATTTANSFVSCQFDASAPSGTIPTALLQNLTKTDATTTAILTTDHSNAKEIVAGDYSIHLAVGSIATQSDGKTPYKTDQVTIF
jgi:hypothetical protein